MPERIFGQDPFTKFLATLIMASFCVFTYLCADNCLKSVQYHSFRNKNNAQCREFLRHTASILHQNSVDLDNRLVWDSYLHQPKPCQLSDVQFPPQPFYHQSDEQKSLPHFQLYLHPYRFGTTKNYQTVFHTVAVEILPNQHPTASWTTVVPKNKSMQWLLEQAPHSDPLHHNPLDSCAFATNYNSIPTLIQSQYSLLGDTPVGGDTSVTTQEVLEMIQKCRQAISLNQAYYPLQPQHFDSLQDEPITLKDGTTFPPAPYQLDANLNHTRYIVYTEPIIWMDNQDYHRIIVVAFSPNHQPIVKSEIVHYDPYALNDAALGQELFAGGF